MDGLSEFLVRPALWAAFAATLACTALGVRLAPHLAWGDAPESGTRARKPQGRAVPPVGGVAIALGIGLVVGLDPPVFGATAAGGPSTGACVLALALALLVGLTDDVVRGGLAPGRKLALQLVAAAPLGLSAWSPGAASLTGLALALAWLVGGVVAQNLANTFDNADGACAALAAIVLVPVAPLLAAPILGFLPFNLDAGAGGDERRTPSAYLGDAGSHLLGMLVLVALGPLAGALALLLPALDLARLARLRRAEGRQPWHGDRRHLAHRLAAAGLSRPAVVGALLVVAAPAVVVVEPAHAPLAAALVLAAFALALRLTPDPRPTGA